MVNPNKGRALLPMQVIEAARAGDAEAVEQVLSAVGKEEQCCRQTR